MIALVALLGCGQPAATPVAVEPEPIGLAECAVCGMVVGEQPSPRGQLHYRDGTVAHVCSIEELRAQAAAPTGRGKPVSLFVEALPASFDWAVPSTDALPWIAAEDAWFVFGASRPLVMGVPVLTYPDEASASRAAQGVGTKPVRWTQVRATSVPQIPPEATPSSRTAPGGTP